MSLRAAMPTILLAALACCPAGTSRPERDEEEARARRFQEALDALRAETGIPGATAAYLTADGATSAFATGLANVETDEPMTVESRMLAGSIGKTFVAATAIAASHEGKLGLDDRLAAIAVAATKVLPMLPASIRLSTVIGSSVSTFARPVAKALVAPSAVR